MTTRNYSLPQRVVCAIALVALHGAFTVSLRGAEGDLAPVEQAIQRAGVYHPLCWVGTTPPTVGESESLLAALDKLRAGEAQDCITALESFLDTHPSSPWAPSVHANVGRYYEDRGRFSRALVHWEIAWTATRDAKEGAAKEVADFTFAYWTRLLAGLGRVDELTSLFRETKGRVLDGGPLEQIVNGTRAEIGPMRNGTDASFRCGTFALSKVAQAMTKGSFDTRKISAIPSPVTGFSLNRLADLAQNSKLDLVAMKWGGERGLVVPCVVHWKQNHYGAIVREKNGYYEVVDPVLGRPRWMKASDIQEEASGYFLVPRDRLPSSWKDVPPTESQDVIGRGYVYGIWDSADSCGNGSGGSGGGGGGGGGGTTDGEGRRGKGNCAACIGGPGGNPGGTGGNGDSCECSEDGGGAGSSPSGGAFSGGGRDGTFSAHGMPVWEVSEPYINLWLYDEPLGYQSAFGKSVSFRLAYKQRESRQVNNNVFSVGKMWNCSWLSYVLDDYEKAGLSATMVLSGGGERAYTPDNGTVEYHSHTTLKRLTNGTPDYLEFQVSYPNGAKDYYVFSGLYINFCRAAFLAARVDAQGRSTRFSYASPGVKLMQVTDIDGRITTLSYTNTAYPAQITGVQDPFGNQAVLQYDSAGMLTNIVDVMRLGSRIEYNAQGWVTNLCTPYGSTRFEHATNNTGTSGEFGDDSDSYNQYSYVRAVRVVDAVGGTNLYMLRQNARFTYTNSMEFYTNSGNLQPLISEYYISPGGIAPMGTSTLDYYMAYRDSFHWGPKQASTLPVDINTFTRVDYLKARLRHWLHDGSTHNTVSQTLSVEVSPSPDPQGDVEGQPVYYGYEGKLAGWPNAEGTESSPYLVAVPNQNFSSYTYYQRDPWGHPTNIISTYSVTDQYTDDLLSRTNSYIYDTNHVDLVQVIGPRGNRVEGYAYNTNHQVLRATNALNEVTYYSYDSQGRLTNELNPAGLNTAYVYFSSGPYTNWIQQIVQVELGRTNSYTYSNNLVYTHTDERGLTTTRTWDALGRLRRVDYPDGTFITNHYDRLDLVRVVDRMGFTNSYGYDNVRRMTAQTNALGYVTLYDYCTCGALNYTRDAAGQDTLFTYDNAGRRTLVAYPDGYTVNYGYNLLGQLTSKTDNLGDNETYYYNNQGLRYAVSNSLGVVSFAAYDVEDHATNTIDANGVSITMTYDELGRVRTRTYPGGGVERLGYSARGLVAYTNQLNLATNATYGYDAGGRKIAETNANAEITRFYYDASGNLTNLVDGKSQNTWWRYDLYGRVTNKTDHAGSVLFSYSYDANDRLTNRVSAAKGATAYRYDRVGNLTNITYATSPAITLQYDAVNRLTNMVDAAGTTRYTYDAAGQLLTEDGPWENDVVSNTYSNRLRLTLSLAAPSGGSASAFSYAYDEVRRLTNVTSSAAGSFGYEYTGAAQAGVPGRQTGRLSLPSGAVITNSYDTVARLLSTRLLASDSTVLNSYAYGYNAANQRTQQVFTAGNYIDYGYDGAGQLVSAKGRESSGATNRLQEQMGYYYDAAGNLNRRTNNALVQTFNVNNLNALTTVTRAGTFTVGGATTTRATNVTVNGLSAVLYRDLSFASAGHTLADGDNTFTAIARSPAGDAATNSVSAYLPGTTTFAYDGNGNLTNDGRRVFFYDDVNQLVRVVVTDGSGGSTRSDFVYDGQMRRRARIECAWSGGIWVTNRIVRYVYDGNLVLQERWFTPSVSASAVQQQVTYTRGRDLSGSTQGAGGIGGLLARTSLANSRATTSYYHCDGNGNVTCLVSSNQLVVASYAYDPFGTVLRQSGPMAESNLYRFSSKEWHENSGLVYYLYRFCDPGLQRWVNRDPIGELGDRDLFRFVNNAPISRIDLFGFNNICVDANCAGVDLSGYTYQAEEEPNKGPKVLRSLPSPGQCVDADAIDVPGAIYKIGDFATVDIDCSSGKPQLHWGGISSKGSGACWRLGQPKPPVLNWPDVGKPIPPYKDKPPGTPLPPLKPFYPFSIGEPFPSV